MRIAMALLAGALALLFIVAIGFTVLAIQIPAMDRAREAATMHAIEAAQAGTVVSVVAPPVSQFAIPGGTSYARKAVVYGASVVMLFAFLLFLVCAGVLLRRNSMGRSRSVGGQLEMEETRMMQEMYSSLERMDKRIESLETLLLDRSGASGFSERARRGAGRP